MNNLINCTKKTIACALVSMAIVCSMIFGVSAATKKEVSPISISGDYTWVLGNITAEYNTGTKNITSANVNIVYKYPAAKNVSGGINYIKGNKTQGTLQATVGSNTKKVTKTVTIQ